MNSLCVKCKGKLMCGRKRCRILEKYSNQRKSVQQVKNKSFEGSSPPSIFVSWHSYPKVKLAPLSPPSILQDADLLDNPERWYDMDQEKIVGFRETLIRSDKSYDVNIARDPDRELTQIQEMVMAVKPVKIEVNLKRNPQPRISFSETVAPMGPSAPLEKFSLIENPRIPKKIDYLVSDVDVKSATALNELYDSGFAVHSLYKLLSSGLLGVKKKRKLVPTRWSITAADSNLSLKLIEEIKYFPEIDEIQLFTSEHLGNYFYIFLVPGCWSFENLECWFPGSLWQPGTIENLKVIQDHEFFEGRSNYADSITGAYYSARLAVCEHLKKIKRQATVLIFREISPDYNTPLGVWIIREGVRHAFDNKPLTFQDLDLGLKFMGNKLKVPLAKWIKASKVLDRIKHQKRIVDYF